VNLDGDKVDLDALAALNVGVTQEGDRYIFRSPEVDALSEPLAVHRRVVEQVDLWKGLLRMSGDQRVRSIKIGGIVCHNVSETYYVLPFPTAITLRLLDDPPVAPPVLAAIAGRNPKVRRALGFLGRKPSAANLWKAFEVLESDLGGENEIITLGWSTKTEMKRFRYNVNKRRHGVLKKAGTKKAGIKKAGIKKAPPPMSMAEAQEYLTQLIW
jgi:hypothetical protein